MHKLFSAGAVTGCRALDMLLISVQKMKTMLCKIEARLLKQAAGSTHVEPRYLRQSCVAVQSSELVSDVQKLLGRDSADSSSSG